MSRRGIEAAVAALLAVVMLAVGAAGLYFWFTMSVHSDPASVPSTAAALPAGPYSSAIQDARGLARSLLVTENLAGLSVAVASEGRVVWAEGFGWANVENRAPVTPLTRFRIGRAGIPLASVAVGRLHEEGRLDLDAPVQRYLPTFPAKQWPFSTRQVMGHVAGIRRGPAEQEERMPGRHCASLRQVLEVFRDAPLIFRPGTQYRYSTYDWILVSAVIEAAAGDEFFTFMKKEVLAPASMERTVPDEDGVSDRVSFYRPRTALRTDLGLEEESPADYSCFGASGAFLSTPTDLARFGAAISKPGLLKAETIALLQAPVRLESGATTNYGLGWEVETVQLGGTPAKMVGHKGSSSGGTTSFLTFPDRGLAVAVTSNVSFAKGVAPFALKVAEAFAKPGGARAHR